MKGLAALPIEKQHQLGMDEPKVNWKIFIKINNGFTR